MWISIVFDAEPYSNFHFDADPDPDSDWHKNDANPFADSKKVLHMLENHISFLTFCHSIAGLQFFILHFQHFAIFWKS